MTHFVDPARAALILIDAQPYFVEIMEGSQEAVLARLEHLLLLGREFELPCIATFEHPIERNGWLPERLERVFPPDGQRFIKRTFNLCLEPNIVQAIESLERNQLVVAGAETDVCVLLSVLGLLERGFQVFVAEDCLFTAENNTGPALRRMYQAGAIPLTYKTLYHELKRSVDLPGFHHRWNEVFDDSSTTYVSPYLLPTLRPMDGAP
jgi:nicotinamidase-related amidase